VLPESRDRCGDLGRVSGKSGQHAKERLREPESLADPLEPGNEQPACPEAHDGPNYECCDSGTERHRDSRPLATGPAGAPTQPDDGRTDDGTVQVGSFRERTTCRPGFPALRTKP
jgi:hypothetical protein